MKKTLGLLLILLLLAGNVYSLDQFSPYGGMPSNPIFGTVQTTGNLTVGTTTTGANATINATQTPIHTFTPANWNEDGVTWTMGATGPLVHVTGNTTTVTATNTEAIVAGTSYRVQIAGTGGGGTATYTLGGVTGTTIAASGAIAIDDTITASTTASLIITPASACTVSITSISISKLSDGTGDLTVWGNLYAKSPIIAHKGTEAYPGIDFNNTRSGIYQAGAGNLGFSYLGTSKGGITSGGMWGTSIDVGGNSDALSVREAANHWMHRNSTNQQTVSVANTYASGNYEYQSFTGVQGASFNWTAVTAGTGADNLDMVITPAGTGFVKANPVKLSDGTDDHIFKAYQEPGLGGRLTVGLDETARTMVICDAGDVDTDFGLGASSTNRIRLYHADAINNVMLDYQTLATTSSFSIEAAAATYHRLTSDLAADNPFVFYSSYNIELTDTDGEQSWLYVEPKINQAGTAGYNGLKIKVTETALGTAAAATDSSTNNLILAGTSTDPDKFKVDNSGNVYTSGSTYTRTPIVTKTGTDSVTVAQLNSIVRVTNTATLTLPALSSCTVGDWVTIKAIGAYVITVDTGDIADKLDLDGTEGSAGVTVLSSGASGDQITWVYDTANVWRMVGRIGAWAVGS